MENLDNAFIWATNSSTGKSKIYWEYHYGTWLAGRGRIDEAIKQLEKANHDLAKALLARLYAQKNNYEKRETFMLPSPKIHGSVCILKL